MKKVETVDEYLKTLPKESKEALLELREIVRSAAPKAEEYISYQMPALKHAGRPLVYYAGFKNHTSLFPAGSKMIDEKFGAELTGYKTSKGTIQFPHGKKLPVGLIKQIVKARMKENEEHAKAKLDRSKT
jgi:uncharacterized protein YdhG (YjbR/CyaY superfamily)